VKDSAARIEAIAQEYARSPENTLVVSPDNRSRAEINARIHSELQERGLVGSEEHRVNALVPRQDLTGADRTWAARYQFNDVLLYSRTSKETGIEKGEYARVKSVDAPNNLLTVVRADGSEQTYDPRRQQGVSIYKEQEKAFSVGDRIQFTAPANELKVANRELGTVQSFTDDGRMSLQMDSGRSVSIDPREHPHLDHGYAVTSHSSQGQTADRVLINIDTELGAKDLINNRMAYVSVSRGAHDAQIFTSDREKLPEALSRDVSHQSAHMPVNAKVAQPEIEPKAVKEPAEKVYTMAEHNRHWSPLNEAVTPQEAAQFAWKQETGSIQSYQHVETGRHIHIDGADGQFYDRHREPISAKEGLDYAMPTGHVHSHSMDLPELSIEQEGFGLGL
jgi:ATP-dependent exoDNAse (exonuclease V) alpha subunit